ncbi:MULTISPECIES: YjbF family lipoprotein [Vibrio]|uniref:YjbF family lipoprotein n=1 Tax=Vibrio TaxID=662 RepID=UPI000C163B1A|nr:MULTISPECIES: YjbF family lipoprotein [Vibrio]NNN45431.1 YjbF family lipoprotein [Vibrio sp. 1-1(7)]NNN73285.1 YjbF family lipoprotein [Vibrio sp. 12-2(3-a)]
MRCAYHGLLFTLLALVGCAPQTQQLSETLSVALMGVNDERATAEYAQTLPYASLFVGLENDPNALLVLAWAEPGQGEPLALKWVSNQQELVVTEAGRITKTANLVVGNILSVTAKTPDPLSLNLLDPNTPTTWWYQLHWQRDQQNYIEPAKSQFSVYGQQEKTLPTGQHTLLLVEENVTLTASQQHYQNRYWLSPSTGRVIASEQYLGPQGARLTLSIAKPFAGE